MNLILNVFKIENLYNYFKIDKFDHISYRWSYCLQLVNLNAISIRRTLKEYRYDLLLFSSYKLYL